MEAQFLDVALSLMQEHHLGRDLHLEFVIHLRGLISLIDLNGEIPQGHFVIS